MQGFTALWIKSATYTWKCVLSCLLQQNPHFRNWSTRKITEDSHNFVEYREYDHQTLKSNGKGKGRPRTGQEGPEKEQMYSSTLPSTSALDGGWVVNATPRPLYRPPPSRERPGTHCIGGWVGHRTGQDGCGKSRFPTGIRSPGPSSP